MFVCGVMALNARDCHYCKGTGKVIIEASTTNFGTNYRTKWCNICNRQVSSGHDHIFCKHCGGSGSISSDSSSSGNYSYSAGGISTESPSGMSAAPCYGTTQGGVSYFWQGVYGLPIQDDEVEAYQNLQKTNSEYARKWKSWRMKINASYSTYREWNTKGYHQTLSSIGDVKRHLENTYSDFYNEISNLSPQLSPRFEPIINKILNLWAQEANAYFSAVQVKKNLQQMNDDLMWQQLNRYSF